MGATHNFCPRRTLSWSEPWLWLAIVSALTAPFNAPGGGCFPAPNGLVAWWPGDGDANDIAGTNNGVLQGGASLTNAGLVAGAFSFDGTNSFLQVTDSPVLRPTNLTVEAWVLFSSLDSAGSSLSGDQYIVFKQNSSTNWTAGFFEGFALMKVRQGNSDTFQFQVSSPLGGTVSVGSLTSLSTGVWYHVAAVRGSDFAALYINGVQEGWTVVSFPQDYGNWPLYFASTGQSAWDHKFAGLLDEVSLYNRALGGDEISGIYAAGSAGKCKGAQITQQPQSQTVPAGSDVVLGVAANGFGLLNYQWQFNGQPIAGAVLTNLLLTSVQAAQIGNYTALVSNSLGTATSQVAAITVLLPDLTVTPGPIQTHFTGPPYPELNLVWGVTNQGPGPVAANLSWWDEVYLSTNATLDGSAVPLSTQQQLGPLGTGSSYWQTNTQNGITLAWDPPPLTNLAGYRLYMGSSSRVYAQVIDVGLVLSNRVSGLVPGLPYYFAVSAYDSNGLETPFSNELGFIAPNGIFSPLAQSGAYYLIFKTDVQNSVPESNENNNTAVVPITFTSLPPDLAALALVMPNLSIGSTRPSLSVAWGVTNQGVGPTEWSWSDRLYLSTNAMLDSSAIPVLTTYEQSALGPGVSYWRTNSVTLPVLQSGSYYLILQTDAYHQLADSNYSNNTVSVPLTLVVQAPDLAPLGFSVPSVVSAPPNPQMLLSWGVTNQGTGPALPSPFWTDRIYLSTNSVVQPGQVPLISSYESSVVAAGGSYWRTNLVRVPITQSGTYYFIFQTDADAALYESNPTNNSLAVPVVFNVTPADLIPVQLQVPLVITGPPNPSVSLSYVVTNLGTGPAVGQNYWYDQLYVSTNSVLDATAQAIVPAGGWAETGPVPAGSSYSRNRVVHVPVFQSGLYYLIFQADAEDSLDESNSTNLISVPVSFNIQPADLAPIALTAPGSITGPPFPLVWVSWGVTNLGSGPVLDDETWVDRLFISTVPQLDGSAALVSEFDELGPLAPGASYWRTNLVRIPVIESGAYYLIFQADAHNSVFETEVTNKTIAVPVTLRINPPDLAPLALEAPGTFSGPPNPVITFVWGVTNAGSGPAVPYPAWSDQLFFSTNPVTYWWDTPILSVSETAVVAAAGSYWRTNSAQVPVTESGNYYFIFEADVNNPLFESNPTNNSAVVPVTITVNPPDLSPVALQVPNVVTGIPNPLVTMTWGVTNQGPGSAVGQWSPWVDTVYLSTRPVLDGTETIIGQWAETNTVGPKGAYWRTNTVRAPVLQNGTYYLIFQADSYDQLIEANTNNNTIAVAVSFTLIDPLADSDGDGLTNLVEYALGTDPFNSMDANAAISVWITRGSGNHYLAMNFKQRVSAAALQFQYLPEVSADKLTWHSDGTAVLLSIVAPIDAQFDWVSALDLTPITPAAPRFIRLRVISGNVQSASPIWIGSDTVLSGSSGPTAGLTLFSQRKVGPILCAGVVTGVSSASLTDTNTTFADAQFGTNGLPAYVEFDNGAMIDIISTAPNAVGLASNAGGWAAVGDKYRIRPHATLDSLFGTNNVAGLTAAPNPSQADQILLFIPELQRTFTFFYYSNPSFTSWQGWVQAESFSPAGSQIVYPEQGLMVRRVVPTDANLYLSGQLKTGAAIVPVQPGYNFLGTIKSLSSITLANLELFTGSPTTGVVGGINPTVADNLLLLNSNQPIATYFYYSNPGVYQGWVAANGFSLAGNVPIPPGGVFILFRQAPGAFTWTIPAE